MEFSEKYDLEHALSYHHKHRTGARRKLSHVLETRMAAKALSLVTPAHEVLDLPCGTGRFWELLSSSPVDSILAGDNSPDMLAIAEQVQPEYIKRRVDRQQMSAQNIGMDDNSVDVVFCMRLMHHIGESVDRVSILREFARVGRRFVIVSLWVDGNYQAYRRHRLEASRAARKYKNRHVLPARTFEDEIQTAGLKIVDSFDLLPYISMWRTYVVAIPPNE